MRRCQHTAATSSSAIAPSAKMTRTKLLMIAAFMLFGACSASLVLQYRSAMKRQVAEKYIDNYARQTGGASFLFEPGSHISSNSSSGLTMLSVEPDQTREFLENFAKCSRLEIVDMSRSNADDSVIPCLRLMPSLKLLSLAATKVTDKSIDTLVSFRLESIDLRLCDNVSAGAIRKYVRYADCTTIHCGPFSLEEQNLIMAEASTNKKVRNLIFHGNGTFIAGDKEKLSVTFRSDRIGYPFDEWVRPKMH